MDDDEQDAALSGVTYVVEPDRVDAGSWSNRHQRFVGVGDIAASYSADKISSGKPIRTPFNWRDDLWLAVLLDYGANSAQAYRLVAPEAFDDEPVSLGEKIGGTVDRARADPNGFYHGVLVVRSGRSLVLCGPPARFVAGRRRQLGLFGDE